MDDQHKHLNGPRVSIWVMALILMTSFLLFGPFLRGEFIWDDHNLVKDNTLIRSFANTPRIFTGELGSGSGARYNFYRPTQILTYAAGYALWGLNPEGYHALNIFLHGLVGICLYCMIVLLFKNRLCAACAGLLFIAHPVHTETVAYISNLSELLAALFILLSFIFYVRWASEGTKTSYALMLTSFILALLSKENALMAPLLFLAYHFIFRKKFRPISFLPIILVAAGYLVFRSTVTEAAAPLLDEGSFARLSGFFVAFLNYIRLLFFPVGLHMEYGMPIFDFFSVPVLAGFLIFCLMALFIYKRRGENSILSFSLAWFLAALLPFTNVFALPFYMAEHYLYVPSMAFSLLVGCALSRIYQREKLRRYAALLFLLIIGMYAFTIFKQSDYWREPVGFYKKTLLYEPNNARIYHNLGDAYNDRGKYTLAIEAYKQALRLEPDQADSYTNLGVALFHLGDIKGAIMQYNKALEIDPYYEDAHNNLGTAFDKQRRFREAVASYKKAIRFNPNYVKAYVNLGIVYRKLGDFEQAISSFEKAIAIDPANYTAFNELGNIYFSREQIGRSIKNYKRAIKANPDYAAAYYNLAISYNASGNRMKAVEMFEKMIGLDPMHADAYYNLGAVFMGMGEYEKAEKMFLKVVDIKPQADVFEGLARIYLQTGEFGKAIQFNDLARKMGKVDPDLSSALEPYRRK